MHTVYIIYSELLDQYFVGQTKDLKISLWQHNARAHKATATGKPWVLKFTQAFETRKEAQSLEMRLKAKKREDLEEFANASTLPQE